jgi:hypothetical protein
MLISPASCYSPPPPGPNFLSSRTPSVYILPFNVSYYNKTILVLYILIFTFYVAVSVNNNEIETRFVVKL